MKKLHYLLTLAFSAVLVLASCTPKDEQKNAVAEGVLLVNGDPAFPSTSVGFKFNVANIESYAMKVEEGENLPSPNPVAIYAESNNIVKITDGEHPIYVYGVEGAKTYTVHFAFKVVGENRYISKSFSTSTPAYTRRINVISADRFEIKVHFNVPEGQNFRYIITDVGEGTEDRDDLTLLRYGVKTKGPQVVAYTDGKPTALIDSSTNTAKLAMVKPGMALAVIMAYCDEEGNIAYTGGDKPVAAPQYASSLQPNEQGYTEKCADTHYTLTDPYAKVRLVSAAPIMSEDKFEITSSVTEINSKFTVTPPSSVTQYAAVVLPATVFDEEQNRVGKDGILEYLQRNMKAMTGTQTFENSTPLEKDENYKFIIIAQCDQIGEIQIREVYDFKALVSTKPAVELVVTNITNHADGAYQVKYNIKAPKKDCVAATYILNYVKEIEPMLGSGTEYKDIIFRYGKKMTPAELKAINSDAGLDYPFDSFEDMENRLVIASFNDEEKMEVFYKDSRSGVEPAKPEVTSPLFSSLIGNWNVTFKFFYNDNPTKEQSATFVTSISSGPAAADPTFGPSHTKYPAMLNYYKEIAAIQGITASEREQWAIEAINAELTKYNEAAPRFAKKYKGQNRLVMNGFCYNVGGYGLDYMSSWDLFTATQYSSYDIDQLFFDYGPKLFLEVAEGDVLTLQTDPKFIAPFNYHSAQNYVTGHLNGENYYGAFPIEVIDKDNFKIKKSASYENRQYSFAIVRANGMPEVIAVDDITLSRATAAQAMAARSAARVTDYRHTVQTDSRPKRTALPMKPTKAPAGSTTQNCLVRDMNY